MARTKATPSTSVFAPFAEKATGATTRYAVVFKTGGALKGNVVKNVVAGAKNAMSVEALFKKVLGEKNPDIALLEFSFNTKFKRGEVADLTKADGYNVIVTTSTEFEAFLDENLANIAYEDAEDEDDDEDSEDEPTA